MRARIPIVLACAALLAVACQDTPTEPVDPPIPTAPEFNYMNNPKDHPVVARFVGSPMAVDYFEDEGFVVFFGNPMDAYCAGEYEGKGDQNFVSPPSEVGWLVNLQEDEAYLTVFDLASFTDECESEPLYKGMGELRYTINGYGNTIGRPQIFHHRIHGTVFDAGGSEHDLFLKVFQKYAADWTPISSDALIRIG